MIICFLTPPVTLGFGQGTIFLVRIHFLYIHDDDDDDDDDDDGDELFAYVF